MTKVLVANIQDNLYRDRNLNPTTTAKKAELKESIEQTGFWKNVLIRFKDNQLPDGTFITTPDQLEGFLETCTDLNGATFELAYGHHRLDVLKDLAFSEVDLPISFLSDEDMLRIMSNENKAGWEHGIATRLETVRQVEKNLNGILANYTTYDEYVEDFGKTTWCTKKIFENAKKEGIGIRPIQAFLGKEWKKAWIAVPIRIMSCINSGYFAQEDILGCHSLGHLETLCQIVTCMHEGANYDAMVVDPENEDKKIAKNVAHLAPVWPLALKNSITAKLINMCEEDADGNMKILKKALHDRCKPMVVKGVNPVIGGQKAIDVFGAIKRIEFKMLYDPSTKKLDDDGKAKLKEQMLNVDLPAFIADGNYTDLEDFDGFIESVRKSIEKLLSPLEDMEAETMDDPQSEIDSAPSSEYAVTAEIKGLEVEEVNAESGEVMAKPIGAIIANLNQSLGAIQTVVDNIYTRAADVSIDDEVQFLDALGVTVRKLALLHGTLSGKDTLTADISKVMKAMG